MCGLYLLAATGSYTAGGVSICTEYRARGEIGILKSNARFDKGIGRAFSGFSTNLYYNL